MINKIKLWFYIVLYFIINCLCKIQPSYFCVLRLKYYILMMNQYMKLTTSKYILNDFEKRIFFKACEHDNNAKNAFIEFGIGTDEQTKAFCEKYDVAYPPQ